VATISDNISFVCGVFLEGSNSLLGAAFLGNANNGIEDQNGENLKVVDMGG
jgi:hypothetical protein